MKLKKIASVLLSALITVTTLSGCSKSEENSTNVINVFNCADYIDEDLITKFEEETGYTIKYSTYDTNENMYSKLTSGSSNYDLVFPSDYMIEKMISENLAEEIDFSNIPNFKYINDDYKNLSYDPENKYSVPYMWGTVGIIYDPEVVTEPVTSWDIIWDEQYKDNVLLFKSIKDTMGVALRRLGYSMNSRNIAEINAATDSLIDLKKKKIVKAWVVDEVKDMMISGEAAIATVWSGDANYIMGENPDLKYVVPEEGSNKWFDCMVIPKGAKNKEGAEAFINFLTDPENSKQNVDYIGYYTPNTATFEMLDEETKEKYPTPEILEKCEIFKNLSKEAQEIYNDEWVRIGAS
ncbi:MAG: spermidine/putrescine ABC transporter substrate-binding protein [Clostridium sp.]|nr:spermidine/putrescine ABC transporter substrate-binding protein [Clostridium sp.]